MFTATLLKQQNYYSTATVIACAEAVHIATTLVGCRLCTYKLISPSFSIKARLVSYIDRGGPFANSAVHSGAVVKIASVTRLVWPAGWKVVLDTPQGTFEAVILVHWGMQYAIAGHDRQLHPLQGRSQLTPTAGSSADTHRPWHKV